MGCTGFCQGVVKRNWKFDSSLYKNRWGCITDNKRVYFDVSGLPTPHPPYMSIHPLESQSVPELKSRCVNCAILFTSLKIKNIPKLTFTLSSNYLIKTIFFSLDNGNDSDIIRQTEDDHSKSLFETQTYSA